MNSNPEQYNIAAICSLLRDAFTARDLWRLCQERPAFQPVLARFGYKASLDEMIDVLIEYCQTQLLFDELLAAIHQSNPKQYERYQAVIHGSGSLPGRQIPHNLPPRSEFVGRDKEKARTHEALCSRWPLISIEGIGGIGKTALALEVAYECLDVSQSDELPAGVVTFDSFVWTTAKDRDLTLNALLDAVAITLDYPGIVQRPLDQKRVGVVKLLQNKPCLLIVDNFETIRDDQVRGFLSYLPEPSKALITTRKKELDHAWTIPLKGLEHVEALALIRGEGRRLGLTSIEKAEDQTLLRLCEATGGTPLALKWAVGQIKQQGQSLDTVLTALHEARGSVFDEIFARSWSLLLPEAQQVIMVMPLFAASASREAIESASDVHHFVLDHALGQLVEMSLLDASDELELARRRYGIHPLTRAFVSARLHQIPQTTYAAQQRLVEYYRSFVETDGKNFPQTRFESFELELPNLIIMILWCWEQQLLDVGAHILSELRYFMIHHGYWNDLMGLSQQAVVLAAESGEELVAAEARYSMGWVHRLRGDLDAAEEQMMQALRVLERLGQERDVARVNRHLGRIAQNRGDLNQAEVLFREALTLYQRLPYHYNYHWVMADLANLAMQRGELDAAQEWCTSTLDSVHGLDDKERSARILSILSHIAHRRGDYDQAQVYAQKSLDLTREAGRRDAIAHALLSIGKNETSLRMNTSAKQHLLEAIEIFGKLDMQGMVQSAEVLLAEVREEQSHE